MKKLVCVSLLSLLCLWPQASGAYDQIELESTYLGDGWFRYRLRSFPDPFFSFFDLGGLVLFSFTNRAEYGVDPLEWQNYGTNQCTGWHWQEGLPWDYHQARPYERVFVVRSTECHFRRNDLEFSGAAECDLITMSLALASDMCPPPWCSWNMVGYASVRCLAPCSAAEADGSPTNLVSRISLIPDIKIDRLLSEGERIVGLSFSWFQESTVQLEASADFVSWRPIYYIYGSPPSTDWMSPRPLNADGKFFRLRLVAGGHATNLPPLNPFSQDAMAPPAGTKTLETDSRVFAPTQARIVKAVPRTSGMDLTIAAQPGTRYTVALRTIEGKVLDSRQRVAAAETETVWLELPRAPVGVLAVVAEDP